MLSFGKVIDSPYFRSDRYFQSVFGWFYAMPKENWLIYQNLGRVISELYILPNPKRSLSLGAGVIYGLIGATGLGLAMGIAAGTLAAYGFAKDRHTVIVKFADGRYLAVVVDDTELKYLTLKSKQVFQASPDKDDGQNLNAFNTLQ